MSEWLTNPTLLQRVKNVHDDSSWSEFNKFYSPYIMMVLKSLKLSHSDADEIAQLIMIKIWKNIPRFEYDPDKGDFRGWVRRVAVNTFRNYVVTKSYKQLSLDQIKESGGQLELPDSYSESEIEAVAEREWQS